MNNDRACLIYEWFGVNTNIVCDTARNDLRELRSFVHGVPGT
jgi:uncharacterized protein with HEPN domain